MAPSSPTEDPSNRRLPYLDGTIISHWGSLQQKSPLPWWHHHLPLRIPPTGVSPTLMAPSSPTEDPFNRSLPYLDGTIISYWGSLQQESPLPWWHYHLLLRIPPTGVSPTLMAPSSPTEDPSNRSLPYLDGTVISHWGSLQQESPLPWWHYHLLLRIPPTGVPPTLMALSSPTEDPSNRSLSYLDGTIISYWGSLQQETPLPWWHHYHLLLRIPPTGDSPTLMAPSSPTEDPSNRSLPYLDGTVISHWGSLQQETPLPWWHRHLQLRIPPRIGYMEQIWRSSPLAKVANNILQ